MYPILKLFKCINIIRSGMNVIRIPSLWQSAILGTVLVLAIVLQVKATMKGGEQ